MGTRNRHAKLPPLPEDIQQRLHNLPSLLARYGVQLAYLFGSLARDRSGQDVDLAVLYEGDIVTLLGALIEHLETERVDLVDLRTAPPFLCLEIFRTGKLIYKRNSSIENFFELRMLNRYLDWEPILRQQYAILKQRYGL